MMMMMKDNEDNEDNEILPTTVFGTIIIIIHQVVC